MHWKIVLSLVTVLVCLISEFDCSIPGRNRFTYLGCMKSGINRNGGEGNEQMSFVISSGKASWDDAYSECKDELGGQLLSIETVEKENTIKKLLAGSTFYNIWTSGRYDRDSNFWYWLPSLNAITYANFKAGSTPNTGPSFRISFHNAVKPYWEAFPKSNRNHYICEEQPKPTPTSTSKPTTTLTSKPTTKLTTTPTSKTTTKLTRPTSKPTTKLTTTPTSKPTTKLTTTRTSKPTTKFTTTATSKPTTKLTTTSTSKPTTKFKTTPTPKTTTILPPCLYAAKNGHRIIVAVDSSSSIAPKDFNLVLDFAINVARFISRRPINKFGFITYSGSANVVIPVDNNKDISDVEGGIRSTPRGNKGRRADLAIEAAVTQFGPYDGTYINALIFITTGKSDIPTQTIASAKKAVPDIYTAPVGINSTYSVSLDELHALTHEDNGNKNDVSVIRKFEDLDGLLLPIMTDICSLRIEDSRSGHLFPVSSLHTNRQSRPSCKRTRQGLRYRVAQGRIHI